MGWMKSRVRPFSVSAGHTFATEMKRYGKWIVDSYSQGNSETEIIYHSFSE